MKNRQRRRFFLAAVKRLTATVRMPSGPRQAPPESGEHSTSPLGAQTLRRAVQFEPSFSARTERIHQFMIQYIPKYEERISHADGYSAARRSISDKALR